MVMFGIFCDYYLWGGIPFKQINRKDAIMNAQNNRRTCDLLSDEEIVALYWQREERAIEATDVKYGKYLYTIAYNILRDGLDSEECLNDTYLGTWNSIPPNKPTVLQVFLSKITRNIALGRFRRATAAKRIPPEIIMSLDELDEVLCFEAGEDEKYLIRELSRILNKYLRSLSDRQSFVFVCRYYYSDSIDSIAKMLGMSANTVLRDLAKIREGLRTVLTKEGYSYE